MIELQNVSYSYSDDKKSINSVSFKINRGERVGLIGANGAGKSTLLKSLVGLITTEGSIKVDDITLSNKTLSEVRKKIGYVIQDSDNQMFMPTVIDDMVFGPINYGMSKPDALEKATKMLETLGISHLKDRYNHKISAGEKKMASIATILTMEPDVLMMDEPSAALDPHNRRVLINMLNKIPLTKIIASHDLDFILDTCDRVLLIRDGQIVADGKVDDILTDKILLEANSLELPFCLQGRN